METIIKNAPQGVDTDKLQAMYITKGYSIEGVNSEEARNYISKKYPELLTQNSKQGVIGEAVSDITGIFKDIGKSSQKRADNVQTSIQSDSSLPEKAFQVAGQLAGAGSDAIGAVGKGIVNTVLSDNTEKQVTDMISKLGSKVVEIPQVKDIINKYNALPVEEQRNIDAAGGILGLASEFIGAGVAKKGVDVAGSVIKKGATIVGDTAVKAGKATTGIVKNIGSKGKEVFINGLSPDIDEGFKKIIKTVDTSKFDEYEAIAKTAGGDLEAPSVYEKVGDSMQNAVEQINKQVKSLSTQKRKIIEQAKVGNVEFKKETGQAILDINRQLKNSAVGKQFIEKLKKVNTKADADRVIDELQDEIYKGSKNMTLPGDSKEANTLKKIVRGYNAKLKDSLPPSYRTLNEKISSKLDNLDLLNTSLGETIDGVPTRGAGLVKQFFSPAGTKAKGLFKFIKENTGINLAEDAVLAKYLGQVYGDVKVNSLLSGIPTTKSGVIDSVTDFALDKLGANNVIGEAKRKGMINKARKLTK